MAIELAKTDLPGTSADTDTSERLRDLTERDL